MPNFHSGEKEVSLEHSSGSNVCESNGGDLFYKEMKLPHCCHWSISFGFQAIWKAERRRIILIWSDLSNDSVSCFNRFEIFANCFTTAPAQC